MDFVWRSIKDRRNLSIWGSRILLFDKGEVFYDDDKELWTGCVLGWTEHLWRWLQEKRCTEDLLEEELDKSVACLNVRVGAT